MTFIIEPILGIVLMTIVIEPILCIALMTFVIEPIDIAKPSKDARKHLWKALYLSIIMRVTPCAIPPPKVVGINTLELFLRLRDMLYEWLSVILRLFVLYLMFACNGDGSL